MTSFTKTRSETLFEQFLTHHRLPFESVPVADKPRPDYSVGGDAVWGPVLFEVKELTEDDDFRRGRLEVSTRILGDHVRRKISESKKQIQYGAKQGIASVLLIYNSLDTVFHLFGTEPNDFLAAMHGEWTLAMNTVDGQIIGSGYGRNRSFRAHHNTSFTALGHLVPVNGIISVRLYPNEYASIPLPRGLPTCFEIVDG